jgi:DNA-binding MarR family transcriptional regulator
MDPAADLWESVNCHCLAARRTARQITRDFEAMLRPHGLRATQFSILAALTLKGRTPVSELAEMLGLERTSLTRSAEVVRRNGWIAMTESADARERPLRVTAAGRRKLKAAFPAWREAQQAVAGKIARGDYRKTTRRRNP